MKLAIKNHGDYSAHETHEKTRKTIQQFLFRVFSCVSWAILIMNSMAILDNASKPPQIPFLSPGEHPYNLRAAMERFESGYLHNILVLADWNLAEAASMLGIPVTTLSVKIETYQLERK